MRENELSQEGVVIIAELRSGAIKVIIARVPIDHVGRADRHLSGDHPCVSYSGDE